MMKMRKDTEDEDKNDKRYEVNINHEKIKRRSEDEDKNDKDL